MDPILRKKLRMLIAAEKGAGNLATVLKKRIHNGLREAFRPRTRRIIGALPGSRPPRCGVRLP